MKIETVQRNSTAHTYLGRQGSKLHVFSATEYNRPASPARSLSGPDLIEPYEVNRSRPSPTAGHAGRGSASKAGRAPHRGFPPSPYIRLVLPGNVRTGARGTGRWNRRCPNWN